MKYQKPFLDESKVRRISKKEIVHSVSIYVANEVHFVNNFMNYNFGRSNIFRIRSQYKENSNEKQPITDSQYPYVIYSNLLENLNKTWKQMITAVISSENEHVNIQYDYHQLCNKISANIQKQLSLWRNSNGTKFCFFTMEPVERRFIFELFKSLDSTPLLSNDSSYTFMKNLS